jgi:CRISPR system Cascade subunit CasA
VPKQTIEQPAFNLWTEPWIGLQHATDGVTYHGIRETLERAHEFQSIVEASPLVVTGIHRLLTAILQATINPQHMKDLRAVWREGRFPPRKIAEFGKAYGNRFDLFSAREPFLQSADLGLQPVKEDKAKTVAYLAPEIPAGTAITHYRHGADDAQAFCPVCAAGGLVVVPAFATSGGAGIKPSINGVPPIYVLPGGQTLFDALAASLLLPNYLPEVASTKKDAAWWLRPAKIERSKELRDVGYLHSLTFPARRVRLHPEPGSGFCTRCGRESAWLVRTMVFDMGESRPKGAAFWRDPFAAYRRTKKGEPAPIRPAAGKALWREFVGLFLTAEGLEDQSATERPRVLDQIAALELGGDLAVYPFRCIGLRTDMKAKIFEWVDAGFEVPLELLRDEAAANVVREGMRFAAECGVILARVYGGLRRKQSKRYEQLRVRMLDAYWAALAAPFREFVMSVATPQRDAARSDWCETVLRVARREFVAAAEAIGDRAEDLRRRVVAERRCFGELAKKREEYFA